jgi:hypothetical protein
MREIERGFLEGSREAMDTVKKVPDPAPEEEDRLNV